MQKPRFCSLVVLLIARHFYKQYDCEHCQNGVADKNSPQVTLDTPNRYGKKHEYNADATGEQIECKSKAWKSETMEDT